MGKAAGFLFLFSAALSAQTAETAIFRVVMLPASEVPAVNSTTRGTADILASAVYDASGQIVSGTVDILARVTFAAAATATGLDIRNGAAGQNGTVAIGSGLSPTSFRSIQSGGDTIHIPVQITGSDPASLTALRALFQDPSKFYLNLLTTDLPNGAIRGQLQRAQSTVLLGLLSSDNAIPPASMFATGVAQVVAIGTRDASGNWTSGELYLSANYLAFDLTAITTFQIHQGAPGANTAAVFSATLPASLGPDPSGAATLGPYYVEATLTNAAQSAAFSNLFNNPAALYIDLHTTANPAGVARAPLRPTGSMSFPLLLASANETTAPTVPATATASLTVYVLRNPDGSLAAATILTDIDYRFPGATQFIGLYLRSGTAGQDGPVALKLAPDFYSDTGFGNYFAWGLPVSNLAALEAALESPASDYASLHTLGDPAGAARAQLAPPVDAPSSVAAVIAANLDKNATTVAPGELVSLFGANLAPVATDLSGWTGQNLPVKLNGVQVTIGGRLAPLLYVSPNQINAQVPVDRGAGSQPVIVNGSSPLPINIAVTAPAIFFSPLAAIVKNANYSLVSTTNPAHAGDILLIYATGLGATSPAFATGQLAPANSFFQTTPVTVTLAGKSATVVYSIASPQFAGLYQVAITVPSGVSGTIPLVIQQGPTASNSVPVSVQ